MKHNLTTIFIEITAVTSIEEYSFTANELWEWMVFEGADSYLNNSLEIHLPSGIPIKERNCDLDKSTEFEGEFLLFNFIEHCPSYRLIKLEKAQDIANLMLSASGIFNSFTTVQIPIVKGEIFYPKKLLEMNFYPNKNDWELINDFQKILNTEISFGNFSDSLNRGRNCVIKHKDKGLSQKRAYDVIFVIKLVYDNLEMNVIEDFIDEVLDYICGYIGNKELWIWENRM